MASFKKIQIILLSFLGIFFNTAYGKILSYDGHSRIVGSLEYAIIDPNCNDLHDLARQYNVGYDALLLANPALSEDTELHAGMVVMIPNQVILPTKIKPNTIHINLAEKRLFFYESSSQKLYIFPVGIGRLDHPSPMGNMYITLKRYKPQWNVPSGVLAEAHANGFTDHPKIMPAGPNNPLGDYAIHLSAHTYLIHATHNPDLIGTRNTSGCINLYPEHLAILYAKVSVNTKVEIINKPIKEAHIGNTLFLEAHPQAPETTAEAEQIENLHKTPGLERVQATFAQKMQRTPSAKEIDKMDQILQNPHGYPIAVSS